MNQLNRNLPKRRARRSSSGKHQAHQERQTKSATTKNFQAEHRMKFVILVGFNVFTIIVNLTRFGII